MSVILLRDLLGMPVETEQGLRLGFLSDGEMDTAGFQLRNVTVKSHRLPFPAKTLLIHVRHIVAVTEEKVVVQDAAIPAEEEKRSVTQPAAVPGHFQVRDAE